jgi:hypothetical protein
LKWDTSVGSTDEDWFWEVDEVAEERRRRAGVMVGDLCEERRPLISRHRGWKVFWRLLKSLGGALEAIERLGVCDAIAELGSGG